MADIFLIERRWAWRFRIWKCIRVSRREGGRLMRRVGWHPHEERLPVLCHAPDEIDSLPSKHVLLVILRGIAVAHDLTVVVCRIVELIVLVFLPAEPFVPAWCNVLGPKVPRIAIEVLPNQDGPVASIVQP